MTDSKLYQLIDVVEEISKLDEMIELHKKNGSDFMLSQYNEKKIKLTGYLIHELIQPAENSYESLIAIRSVLDKFFKYSISEIDSSSDQHFKNIKRLIEVIE